MASEHIIYRINTDSRSGLVVSEFAGIATQLSGAVQVNPYNLDRYADAIGDALRMDEAERRARMARMRQQVRANPVAAWGGRCLGLGVADVDVPAGVRGLEATPRPLAPWPSRDA